MKLSIVYGYICCFSFTSLITALFYGRFNVFICLSSLLLSVVGIVFCSKFNIMPKESYEAWEPKDKTVASLFFLFVALFSYFYLIVDTNSIATLHSYNYGDLSVHLQYIKAIANGISFWPQNPIFPIDSTKYPFGSDFINAHFEVLGIPTQWHLFGFSMLMTYLLFQELYRLAGFFAILCFLLGGGFAIYDLEMVWKDFLDNVYFKNLFLSLWNTQRGFLMGLPLGLFVLNSFKSYFTRNDWNSKNSIFIGFLWGSLAFFHMHSFFVISLVFSFQFFIFFKSRKKIDRSLFYLVFTGFLVSIGFVVNSLLAAGTEGFVRWDSFWGSPGEGFFAVLLENFGLWWLLYACILYHSFKKKDYLPIFYLCCFVLFHFLYLAPWDWDNIKLLVWFFVLLLPYSKEILLPLSKSLKMAIYIILFSFGCNSLVFAIQKINKTVHIASLEDLSIAEQIIKKYGVNSVFLVIPEVNHPVILAGGSVRLGYPGHIWSHGIRYRELETRLIEFYTNPSVLGLKALKTEKINYVVWGPREREHFKRSHLFTEGQVFYDEFKGWHIYSTQ